MFAGVSFAARAGERLALTGASGAGKTTLLNLMRGLLEPDCGDILIEGQPILSLSPADLARIVGYLPQRTALVSGTIADNLRLACPDAADDALWQVLTIAALDSAVSAKGGLDFRLGEAGRGLSGGEQRRLALARMLLRRPRILLLDEPTEGLDHDTAQAVLGRLAASFPDAAIVIAAHRSEERAWAGHSVALG